jgi:hypothetical protein
MVKVFEILPRNGFPGLNMILSCLVRKSVVRFVICLRVNNFEQISNLNFVLGSYIYMGSTLIVLFSFVGFQEKITCLEIRNLNLKGPLHSNMETWKVLAKFEDNTQKSKA